MDRYLKMKKADLMALAKEAGIKGRSKMTKQQLATAMRDIAEAVEPTGAEGLPGSTPLVSAEPVPQEGTPAAMPVLPGYLGTPRLCLLPQKPAVAFAYWELEAEPPDGLVLQIFSLPGRDQVMSRSVRERLGTWYIELPRSAMEVEAELGIPRPDRFETFLRSNRIRLPADAPSEEMDTLWMTRRREFEEIFRLSGGHVLSQAQRISGYGRGPGAPVTSWRGPERRDDS